MIQNSNKPKDWKCPNCKNKNTSATTDCYHCGHFHKDSKRKRWSCERCKTLNTESSKYCRSCGHWLLDSYDSSKVNDRTKRSGSLKTGSWITAIIGVSVFYSYILEPYILGNWNNSYIQDDQTTLITDRGFSSQNKEIAEFNGVIESLIVFHTYLNTLERINNNLVDLYNGDSYDTTKLDEFKITLETIEDELGELTIEEETQPLIPGMKETVVYTIKALEGVKVKDNYTFGYNLKMATVRYNEVTEEYNRIYTEHEKKRP